MKKFALLLLAGAAVVAAQAKTASYTLKSPDGKVSTRITAGETFSLNAEYNGAELMQPSQIGLVLDNSSTIGPGSKVKSTKRTSVSGVIASPFYRSESIPENYNQLTLHIDKNWDVQFRAYNDGIAYRFVSNANTPFKVMDEIAEYNFTPGTTAAMPFVKQNNPKNFEQQFFNSFEAQYTIGAIDKMDSKRLAFLPVMAKTAGDTKVVITEANIDDYPGMFLNAQGNTLKGIFPPYPKTIEQGGHNMLQGVVKSRENYIARIEAPRALPWRIIVVAGEDKTLAATELSYLLGAPNRLADISWIKPGKVAWEWWNAWNIDGVDFKTGVNNDTYKAYIDFASEKGIEYVILDEGWAVNKKADLFQVVPEINLEELIAYGKEKNVGIILWAGYLAFERDMERVCKHYSEMGVKGFKVDFFDRNDQPMTKFFYDAAETAARYNLVLDMHGAFIPAGLNRTYPNVLNVEGVFGLENMKWSKTDVDQVTYDVQIPFIRQIGGPMDYTQGAMRNASKGNYYPCNSEPMSQGTRCRQLALYMILDSPLNMLCDSPSNYRRNDECATFIAEVPTSWDETRILKGKFGEYIVTARRKGDTWYIGGITDWTPRDIELDLSFLTPGMHKAEIFSDGANAPRIGRDYKRTSTTLAQNSSLKLHLAPGGGFAAIIR